MKHQYGKNAGELHRMSDLNFKLRMFGRRFICVAAAFYVLIPLLYYQLHLGWRPIDAFYVSTCLAMRGLRADVCVCAVVLRGDLLQRRIWGHRAHHCR